MEEQETITTGYFEWQRSCHGSGKGCSWLLSLYLGFPVEGRDTVRFLDWENRPLTLLCFWYYEGKEAAVAVGRIGHHCRALSPTASYREWSPT